MLGKIVKTGKDIILGLSFFLAGCTGWHHVSGPTNIPVRPYEFKTQQSSEAKEAALHNFEKFLKDTCDIGYHIDNEGFMCNHYITRAYEGRYAVTKETSVGASYNSITNIQVKNYGGVLGANTICLEYTSNTKEEQICGSSEVEISEAGNALETLIR